MSTYFLNANPSGISDGLTPDTGYTNLITLKSNVPLIDGDIVQLVNNGPVIEPPAFLLLDKNITISSYNNTAATWRTHPFVTDATINGLKIIGTIGNPGSITYDGMGQPIFNFTPQNITIKNCVFYWDPVDSTTSYYGSVQNFIDVKDVCNLYIANNDFYGNGTKTRAISIKGQQYNSKTPDYTYSTNINIINNIFYELSYCVDTPGIVNQNIRHYNIDFNFDYNCYLPYRNAPVGINNIRSIGYFGMPGYFTTDPQIADASTVDFSLRPTSPCRDAGANQSEQSIVPAFDILGIPRPQGLHTDIGAYEYNYASMNVMGCIDGANQIARLTGYVVADTTRMPTDMTFMQYQELSRGDLTLALQDWTYANGRLATDSSGNTLDGTYVDGTWGFRRYTPEWLNFSIWHWDYDTSQTTMEGYKYRTAISDNVGSFYAPMVVPKEPGHYEIRWRYKKDESSYAKEVVQGFLSLSRGIDTQPDYPIPHVAPYPYYQTRDPYYNGVTLLLNPGVDPGVDVIGLFEPRPSEPIPWKPF